MATKNVNNKSSIKGIRFPHELIEAIDSRIEAEKVENPSANFSAWVIESCQRRIDVDPKNENDSSPLRQTLEVLAKIEKAKEASETDLEFVLTAALEEIKRRQRRKAKAETPEE